MKIECNCVEKTAEELLKERNRSLEIIPVIGQDKQNTEAKRNEISYEKDMLLTQKSILNELEYVSKILEDINNGIRVEKIITKDLW